LASASALARALRSSSVKVRSTTPELLRGARATAGQRDARGAALATTGSGAAGGASDAGYRADAALAALLDHPCLVRPWLKLGARCPARRAA